LLVAQTTLSYNDIRKCGNCYQAEKVESSKTGSSNHHLKTIVRKIDLNNNLHYRYIMNQTKSPKIKSKPMLMSNIRTSKFQGFDFYHTISSRANWEKQGHKYIMPQQKAFDTATDEDVLLVRDEGRGKSYGSMPFEDLEKIYKQNHYLYEILKDERKFYMDIEFPYENDEQATHKLGLIFKLVRDCFAECGIETGYKRKRDFFSKNIGVGEAGGFKDIKKFSSHLIMNDGNYFKSYSDINKFAKYMRQTIDENEDLHDLIFETDQQRNYAIDFGVYTKNRLFKLPYQSKPKSSRIQKPPAKTPDDLEKILISNPVKSNLVDVSKLTLKTEKKSYQVKNKAGKVIGKNIPSNVADFLEAFKKDLPDECPIPDGEPDSGSLEYVVASIHNSKAVNWDTFCAVGMAIKRASGGNGFQLWVEWTRKGGWNLNITEMSGMWGRFTTEGYGYSTLLNLAKLCNPNLIAQHPTGMLFELKKHTYTRVVNKRYLNENDFNLKQYDRAVKTGEDLYNKETHKFNYKAEHVDNEVSYIKSPMGTGKSFNIHQIQKDYNRIVYLSSKRAFATAMGKEFEKDGFKNYIDLTISERYNCPKIIISLESFHQINPDDIDLLIIDESESIFNIIGSHTLQVKGEGLNNLLVFEKAVRTARKVLVMDAFLSKRSMNAVDTIRPRCQSALTINEWKPPKRTAKRCKDKAAMWLELKKCLEAGERCCVVSGSKKYAIHLVDMAIKAGLVKGELDDDGIYREKDDVKLYHSSNPLDLATNVNEEWSKCKLLLYSPTITCGISYDNPDEHFDRLFVYMPNIFSACFRDAVQALKRVRHFKNDELFFCLNTQGNYNKDMSPVYFDKVKELIYNYKTKIFSDDEHYISLQAKNLKGDYRTLKDWVSEARIYNILEANISGIYIEIVCSKYFALENIEIKGLSTAPKNYEMPEFELKDAFTFEEAKELAKKIPLADITQKREKGDRLTLEEYWAGIYYNFYESVEHHDKMPLYWDYYIKMGSEERSHYYSTIKFHKVIHQNSIDEIYKKQDSMKILELNNFHDERYQHLYNMFNKLGFIEDNKLNYKKEFMKEDLEPLLKEYESLRMNGGIKAFNQLLKHGSIREWSAAEDTNAEMDTDKIYIMIKHLAYDLLGLACGQVNRKKKRVMVDGKKKQKFFGVFKFSPLKHHIYELDEVGEPKRDDKGKCVIKEIVELDVMSIAHSNFEEPLDISPKDWFNDSGNGSNEEEEELCELADLEVGW